MPNLSTVYSSLVTPSFLSLFLSLENMMLRNAGGAANGPL